jgi:hypothetical protein
MLFAFMSGPLLAKIISSFDHHTLKLHIKAPFLDPENRNTFITFIGTNDVTVYSSTAD